LSNFTQQTELNYSTYFNFQYSKRILFDDFKINFTQYEDMYEQKCILKDSEKIFIFQRLIIFNYHPTNQPTVMQKLLVKHFFIVLTILVFIACSSAKPKSEEWIQLFNGKDLNDWDIKITGFPINENYMNTFRVEDGLLKVRYDQYDKFDGHFGHIFYKQPFSNYRIRAEYRFVGEQAPGGEGWAFRNSGIMIHGQSAESMAINQNFPTSIEVQLLGGNGTDNRSTLNLCTPGTNVVMNGKLWTEHCTNSTSKTYHGDQWVTVEVEVHGDSIIRHLIDGKTVLEYTSPQLDDRDADYTKLLPPDGNKLLTKGSISLQAESHPVDFRKVELLNLGVDIEVEKEKE